MNKYHAGLLIALGLIPSPLSASTTIPPGYVSAPGGWTHPSCIHEVPNGATIDGERGDVLVNGSIVAHYDPCAYRPVSAPGRPALNDAPSTTPASGDARMNGPAYGGWVENTYQSAPAGQSFDWVSSTMVVPFAPTQQTGETLYYFSGLQSSLDNDCGILQPVLQWGVSPAGGYCSPPWIPCYWSVASWWWGGLVSFTVPESQL